MTAPSAYLFRARVDYSEARRISELPDEEYTLIRSKLPDGRLPPSDRRKHLVIGEFICDLEEAQVWDSFGVELAIKKIRGIAYQQPPAGVVAEALAACAAGGPVSGPTIINVSVAGVGLHAVQTVHWEEDCCTMRLQDFLSDGWRILAVCPPNDARRPTYILGHHVAGFKPL